MYKKVISIKNFNKKNKKNNFNDNKLKNEAKKNIIIIKLIKNTTYETYRV
tara:strand:+ start:469 stop:618 length:150 start_codon:yes stop_codon:yes gene_type:complete